MKPLSFRLPLIAACAAAVLLSGCSTPERHAHFSSAEDGPKTALLRIGGEGITAVHIVENDDAESCFSWYYDRDQVSAYLDGQPMATGTEYPYQGKSLGMPESATTRRYSDKNRWAEIRIPAGQEIELQYSLPYEKLPGSAPKILQDPDDPEGRFKIQDTGALCRTAFRFTPQAGKMYQANFLYSQVGTGREFHCSALVTTLPEEAVVRVRKLDACHRIDYDNLLKFEGFNK